VRWIQEIFNYLRLERPIDSVAFNWEGGDEIRVGDVVRFSGDDTRDIWFLGVVVIAVVPPRRRVLVAADLRFGPQTILVPPSRIRDIYRCSGQTELDLGV
jgi:hypothetical protein